MRDEYRRIELFNNPSLTSINYEDTFQPKFGLEIRNDHIICQISTQIYSTFSFLQEYTAQQFIKNFGDDILKCKSILG